MLLQGTVLVNLSFICCMLTFKRSEFPPVQLKRTHLIRSIYRKMEEQGTSSFHSRPDCGESILLALIFSIFLEIKKTLEKYIKLVIYNVIEIWMWMCECEMVTYSLLSENILFHMYTNFYLRMSALNNLNAQIQDKYQDLSKKKKKY